MLVDSDIHALVIAKHVDSKYVGEISSIVQLHPFDLHAALQSEYSKFPDASPAAMTMIAMSR